MRDFRGRFKHSFVNALQKSRLWKHLYDILQELQSCFNRRWMKNCVITRVVKVIYNAFERETLRSMMWNCSWRISYFPLKCLNYCNVKSNSNSKISLVFAWITLFVLEYLVPTLIITLAASSDYLYICPCKLSCKDIVRIARLVVTPSKECIFLPAQQWVKSLFLKFLVMVPEMVGHKNVFVPQNKR